jgi:hypothetical protein
VRSKKNLKSKTPQQRDSVFHPEFREDLRY